MRISSGKEVVSRDADDFLMGVEGQQVVVHLTEHAEVRFTADGGRAFAARLLGLLDILDPPREREGA